MMTPVALKLSSFALILALATSTAANVQAQDLPTASTPVPNSVARASSDGKTGVGMPSCKYAPPPPYSKEARKAKYEGIVVVEVIVDLDGKLSNMRVVKSPGYRLDESALETLKKWKCTPATGPSGKPVRTSVPVST